MLTSSVLIQCLMTILRTLERWYENSIMHRVLYGMGTFFKNAWHGSFIFRLWNSFDRILVNSFAFRILRFFVRLVNTIAEWVRLRLESAIEGSVVFTILSRFRYLSSALLTGGMAAIGFGLALLIIGVLRGKMPGIYGGFFLMVGFLSCYFSYETREKAQTSYAMGLLKKIIALFVHDEEAASWNEH